MTHIPIPQRLNNKVEGDFYPLQKQELIALYKAKLINNVAFVHFALRCENPFCDRPITLIIKEFAMRWGIPENSLYQALSKLAESGIIKFNAGKVTIEWQSPDLKKNHPLSETDFQIRKTIFRSEKQFSDPKKSTARTLTG